MAPSEATAWQATSLDDEAVAAIEDEPLEEGSKGAPLTGSYSTVGELGRSGLHALDGTLPMPLLALRDAAIRENVATMAAWCRERDLLLAPHGKTTMAPQLFARQIAAGAWAMTAATPAHLRLYRRFGVQRILYANQLVEPGVIEWVAGEMESDPDFELWVVVDSAAGVRALEEGIRSTRRLPVLLEIGSEGGRAGLRQSDEVLSLAAEVASSRHLRLAGVECFEGVVATGSADALADVDRLLDRAGTSLAAVADLLDGPSIFSAGGSAFFDRVAEGAARLGVPFDTRVVLRSGCYLTHDGGHYKEVSPLDGRGRPGVLREGIELWGVVLSRPEPGLAIAGFGKRDTPYDMGLPRPTAAREMSPAGETRPLAARVEHMYDQHALLRLAPDEPLNVGELVRCSISHPCGAFDRWKVIVVLDEDDRVVEAVRTYF